MATREKIVPVKATTEKKYLFDALELAVLDDLGGLIDSHWEHMIAEGEEIVCNECQILKTVARAIITTLYCKVKYYPIQIGARKTV